MESKERYEFEGQWWEIDKYDLPKIDDVIIERRDGHGKPCIWRSALNYCNVIKPILRPVAPVEERIVHRGKPAPVEDDDIEFDIDDPSPVNQKPTCKVCGVEIESWWNGNRWVTPVYCSAVCGYKAGHPPPPQSRTAKEVAFDLIGCAKTHEEDNRVLFDGFDVKHAASLITAYGDERVRAISDEMFDMSNSYVGKLSTLRAANARLKARVEEKDNMLKYADVRVKAQSLQIAQQAEAGAALSDENAALRARVEELGKLAYPTQEPPSMESPSPDGGKEK